MDIKSKITDINNIKSKITGINNISIITNGSISELSTIDNPNQIGTIVNDSGKTLGQITPLIMIINQNGADCQKKINALIDAGADSNLVINYYGKDTSANEIVQKYRSNLNLY